MEVSGGGNPSLSGTGDKVDLTIYGGSEANLISYQAQSADLNVREVSEVTVNAPGKLDVTVVEGSTVFYAGSPTFGRREVGDGAFLKRR